jgi:hypothetical protein
MKKPSVLIISLILTACGGGGGGDSTPAAQTPAPSTTGSSGNSGNSSTDTGANFVGLPAQCFENGVWFDCYLGNGSGSNTLPGNNSAGAVSKPAEDLEPNNDSANASIAEFASGYDAAQRVGFHIEGEVNATDDNADFYSFVARRGARIDIELCQSESECGADWALDSIAIDNATVRLLDQFGNELLNSGNTGSPGNAFSYDVDAGLLYYVVVVAEDLGGATHSYRLQVLESRQQPNPFDTALPPITTISAPDLTVFVEDSDLNVRLEWTAPSANTDGTINTEIAGYVIYLGQSDGTMASEIMRIEDPAALSQTIGLLGYDGWAVAVSAYNISGSEGDISNWVIVEAGPE